MRWIITSVLAVLVLAGSTVLFFGDFLRRQLGKPPRGQVVASASEQLLAENLKAENLVKIEVTIPNQPTLTLLKGADAAWTQPGNWALRSKEVEELVAALTTLQTRFNTIKLEGDAAALKHYGLEPDQSPVTVAVSTKTAPVTLTFGTTATPGKPAFASPAYVRVNNNAELLRIPGDVLRVVSRPLEEYRRKRLFPESQRVRFSGEGGNALTTLIGDSITTISIKSADGTVTLQRVAPNPPVRRAASRPTADAGLLADELATAWELAAPVRDRPDPAKLRGILTAIPELWVDAFTNKTADAAGLKETGLDLPEREITLTPKEGKPIGVKIGKVSRTVTRDGPPGPPMGPIPPMPTKITEEYRYAKFDDNALIFEMRSDKLPDLSVKADDLRDANLARFSTADVQDFTVLLKGQPPMVVTRKKGNKNAERDEDKQDRWYVAGQPAESAKVTELLDALAKLEAKPAIMPPAAFPPMPPMPPTGDKPILDNPDAKKLEELGLDAAAGTKVVVNTQIEVPDGDEKPPIRSFTFVIGKLDAEKKKLPVQVAGWPRVNFVDDAAFKLIERPALAYRSRRPIDTADLDLQRMAFAVEAKSFELLAKPREPNKPTAWGLVKPVTVDADSAKSSKLAEDLARLEVVEFADDAPKPEDLGAKYGLTKPRATVELGFIGAKPKTDVLELGADVTGKPEVYARLNRGGSVFTLPKATFESLSRGPEDLVKLEQWNTLPDKIREVEVTRADTPAFKLSRADEKWNLSGPFAASADTPAVQPLLQALVSVKAEKYETLNATPTDAMKFGFDKPAYRIKLLYKEPKPGEDPEKAPELDRTRQLVIGNPTAMGATSRFAKLEGESTLPNAVFVISGDGLKPLDVAALELIDKKLLELNPAQIAKVQIVGPTPESNITLVKGEKNAWKAEGQTFPLDKPTAEQLAFVAGRLPVIRLANYGPTVKWADYGLDKPAYTLTLTTSGEKPETKTIFLGKEEATGERYVRVGADSLAVGVISGNGAAALARGKLDFVDRTLLTFDVAALAGFTRKKGMEEFELAQAGVNWEVTKPTKFKADTPLVEELGDQLARLRATKVAAFAPKDLKPFGLDAPAAAFSIKIGIEKIEIKTLNIGKPVEDANPNGDRYAALDSKGDLTVGVIPAFLANRLLGDPIKFKDRALGGFRGDPDKITIERGERKLTFTKDGGTWKLAEPTKADAEQIELDELVNAAAKLRADELIAEKAADLKPFGLDAPQAKVRFFTGTTEALALFIGAKEKDGSRVYAKLEKGDAVGFLDLPTSTRVLSEFRKRSVWSGVDAAQAEVLTVSSGTATFVLRKTGGEWLDAEKLADKFDTAKVTDTLAALAGLKAERYAADQNADLKLFGLEKPSRVIVVGQQGGISKTLELGSEVGGTNGKQIYARVKEPGRTDVFVLSEADTVKLVRDRAGYMLIKK
jgi:hypothetical protein